MRAKADISTLEGTKWEVAVIRNGVILEVLGYTARKTKQGILNLMVKDLTSHFTEDELNADYKYSKDKGFQFGDGSIRIGFTGRTERQVAK